MRHAVGAVALALAFAGCGPLEEASPAQLATRRQAVVNGRVSFGDPEIFAYLAPGWMCSSTLIGRRTLLTAGHCVTGDSGRVIPPTGVVTNVVDSDHVAGDYIEVVGIKRHPDYTTVGSVSDHDVALLQLAREPFVAIKPWNQEPLTYGMIGSELRVVGYGDTTGGSGAGLKRTGRTVLKGVRELTIAYGSVGDITGNTCQGDSGGPALRTFPDGSERVVGVTSYGYSGCSPRDSSTDLRVDAYASFIGPTLARFEAASCAEDGRCKTGCVPEDPDCACQADGACNAACTGLAVDPDCNAACGPDGVCATTLAACPIADIDCQRVGGSCGHEGHCSSRLCITSAQRPQPYCSRACAAASDCPSELDCVAGRCEYRLRPTAAQGEACTLGETLCEGELFCAAWEGHPETQCMQGCYENADCTNGVCRKSPQVKGVCVPNVLMKKLGNEHLLPVSGCASAPGALLGCLLVWTGLRRRRQ